eukprot:1614006-Amphidinium_carterae.1
MPSKVHASCGNSCKLSISHVGKPTQRNLKKTTTQPLFANAKHAKRGKAGPGDPPDRDPGPAALRQTYNRVPQVTVERGTGPPAKAAHQFQVPRGVEQSGSPPNTK